MYSNAECLCLVLGGCKEWLSIYTSNSGGINI